MKTRNLRATVVLPMLVGGMIFHMEANASAQGSLTPPGPPAPVMKTLDQIQPRLPISSLPFTITNPGSYYLTTSCAGVSNFDGIIVSSGNVTIDLNGFTLFGVPNSHNGILVSGSYSNITIRNGSLVNWGFPGVDANSAGPVDVTLEGLTASGDVNSGLSIGQHGVMRDCLCLNNPGGGALTGAGCLVSDCVFDDNTNSFVAGLYAPADCVVRHCQLSYNFNGVFVYGGRCDLHDCQANSNTTDGVYIYYNGTASAANSASTMTGCSFIGNGHNGVEMMGGSANTGGSPATVSDCFAVGNGQSGIYLNFSPGSRVANCNVVGNGLSGIYIGGDNSQVVGNNCVENNSGTNANNAGIMIFANSCKVEDNHVSGNNYAGIAVKFGNNSIVVKNTIDDGYIFLGSNDIGPIGSASTATSPWANIFH